MFRRASLLLFAIAPFALAAGEPEGTEPDQDEPRVFLSAVRPMSGVEQSDRDAVREMLRIRLVGRGFKVILADVPAEGEWCDSECLIEEAGSADADFALSVTLAKLESEFIITVELTDVEKSRTLIARTFRVKGSGLDDTSGRISAMVQEKAAEAGKRTRESTGGGMQFNKRFSDDMTVAAAVGGFIFPGVGHILLGEGKEGALFAAGWLGVLYYFIGVASPHYASASKKVDDLPNDSFLMYTLTRSYGYDPVALNPGLTLLIYRREEQLREKGLDRVRREAVGVYAGATLLVIGSLADLFLHHLFDVKVTPEPRGSKVKVGFQVKF